MPGDTKSKLIILVCVYVTIASEVQLVPGDTEADGSHYGVKNFPGIFPLWQQLQDVVYMYTMLLSLLTLPNPGSEHNS